MKVISWSSFSKSLQISLRALAGTTTLNEEDAFLTFLLQTASLKPSIATQVKKFSFTSNKQPLSIGLLSSVEQENAVLLIKSLKSFCKRENAFSLLVFSMLGNWSADKTDKNTSEEP